MKLISWNVNGIRACKEKGFLDFLKAHSPDVLGLQETKAFSHQLGDELLYPEGEYITHFHSAERAGYSGTALFSKTEPKSVEVGLEDDQFNGEGRVITADYEKFVFITAYIPNGKNDLSRVDYKIEFQEAVLQHAEKFRKEGRAVIICGDINTAHKEIDLARPKQNRKSTGFLPQECAWMDRLTEVGYIDTFRYLYPDKSEIYSWWSYMGGARARNVGWRIDYFFINEEAKDLIKDAYYLPDVHGSDHCPVVLEINA